MSKSLRSKIVFIMLMLIVLLMTVVLVFLIRGVQSFFLTEFEDRVNNVFINSEFLDVLRATVPNDDAPVQMQDILSAYAGQLGIDIETRNYYILDRLSGRMLLSSELTPQGPLEITPNILSAMNGNFAYIGGENIDYMDAALPVANSAGGSGYIIYIKDNKQAAKTMSSEQFLLILEAVAVGFGISIVISIIISRTLLQPIRGMTRAAEAMSGGDFSQKISVDSDDEIGILARTFNDMASQLEATLDELKNAEKMRREFVANVSHELRTPLTSINTYAETLAENEDIPRETEREFLRVILNESARMTNIVSDLLELSRFDSGNSKLVFGKFSLEQSIRDVHAAILPVAQKSGHELNLELELRLPEITGDRSRIEQVLMNIMTNAIKYTPPKGKINIASGRSGRVVWVRVQDTGIGIPGEDIKHVFDRFYRVDKARTRETGGTGLGLSIAKEIIAGHGGEISIDSAPGEGTTVTVFLPIKQKNRNSNNED